MSVSTALPQSPETSKNFPRIIGFLCNWCSYAGADKAGTAQQPFPANVHTIRVMCSGRIDPQFILKAFQLGADGVLILGCHPGDCHYKEQNYRALHRHGLVQNLLTQFGISAKRCRFDFVSASEGERFGRIISEMVAEISALGPTGIIPDQLVDAYPSWEDAKKALAELAVQTAGDNVQCPGATPPSASPEPVKSDREQAFPAKSFLASHPAVEKSGMPLTELGKKIVGLAPFPARKLLEELLFSSTAAEGPAWIEFLGKDLPPPTLEIVFRSIGRVKSAELTRYLLRFLDHRVARVRANLIEALEMSQDPAIIPYISNLLQDPDNRVKGNVIKALNSFGNISVLDELEKMATDPKPSMRSTAVYALSKLEFAQAAPLLRNLLYDPDSVIRKSAIRAFGKMNSSEGLDVLKEYREMTNDAVELPLVEEAIAEQTKMLMNKMID